jgi:hypothetical protein
MENAKIILQEVCGTVNEHYNTVKDAFNAIGGNLLSRVSDAFSEPNA